MSFFGVEPFSIPRILIAVRFTKPIQITHTDIDFRLLRRTHCSILTISHWSSKYFMISPSLLCCSNVGRTLVVDFNHCYPQWKEVFSKHSPAGCFHLLLEVTIKAYRCFGNYYWINAFSSICSDNLVHTPGWKLKHHESNTLETDPNQISPMDRNPSMKLAPFFHQSVG